MPRQPYSVAVLSTGGRLLPRFLRKRGLGRKWSSPCRRDGEVEKSPSLRVKRDGVIFEKLSFWLKILQMSAMKTRFQIAECSSLSHTFGNKNCEELDLKQKLLQKFGGFI